MNYPLIKVEDKFESKPFASSFTLEVSTYAENCNNNPTLNAMKEWKEANWKSNTIAPFKILKEVCYRDNNSKVNEGIDLINKLTKLLTSRQGLLSTPSLHLEFW